MDQIRPLLVPQVNVNDDSVLLVRWLTPDGAAVSSGDPVCDVETTKAASEVAAPHSGVLVQAAAVGTYVRVGATIGAIGPTRELVAAYLASLAGPPRSTGSLEATPKAKALAAQHGVSLDAVQAMGVQGTIKESDVQRFLAVQASALPGGLARFVTRDGPMPPFDVAVAANLRRSTQHLILTSVDMDCRLTAARRVLSEAQAAGLMASVLHLLIGATARALPAFPRLSSFAHDGFVYRHTALDIAFVARATDGRLFTPVLRGVDRLSLGEIAKAAQAATFRVMRGSAKAEDLEGAAFTISQVPVPGTTRVVALPSFGQSAILGVSAERTSLELRDGAITEIPIVTMTLNYDHALCDGVYAAGFLAALVREMEQSPS